MPFISAVPAPPQGLLTSVHPTTRIRCFAGAAQALSQGETEVDPRTAAGDFRRGFAAQYGGRHPDWVDSGWQDATAAAARQYKFLLVYLHAAEHDDTPKFCRETLTASEVWCCQDIVAARQCCGGGATVLPAAPVVHVLALLQVARMPSWRSHNALRLLVQLK